MESWFWTLQKLFGDGDHMKIFQHHKTFPSTPLASGPTTFSNQYFPFPELPNTVYKYKFWELSNSEMINTFDSLVFFCRVSTFLVAFIPFLCFYERQNIYLNHPRNEYLLIISLKKRVWKPMRSLKKSSILNGLVLVYHSNKLRGHSRQK